jgi:3-oxoadipate enol-lactonase
MPYVAVNGINLYYELHGTGEPIVFAHGRGGNHLSWWQQIPEFSRDHTCIIFDHRSYGASRDSDERLGQDGFVGDLLGLLDSLGIEKAHLVAQSMGGRSCMGLAVQHPERVRRMVLAGTMGGVVDASLSRLVATIGPAPEDLLKRVLSEGFQKREPYLTFLYQQIEGLNHVGNTPTRLTQKGPSREAVKACSVPTLLLAGDEDPLAPAVALHLLASFLQKARVALISGAGHSSYFEKPAEFNRLVRLFLTAPEAEASI